MPFAGFIRAIRAVSIKLTGTDPLHPNVPDVAGAVVRRIQIDDPGGLRVFGMVEELQPNAAGVTAENSEIHPSLRILGSQRQRRARPNVGMLGNVREIILQVGLWCFHHRCRKVIALRARWESLSSRPYRDPEARRRDRSA